MSELVQKLSHGRHRAVVSLRPTPSVEAFKACLDRGYLLVKFTETRGGTELGVTLDREATDMSGADFASASGTVKLVGTLTLDFVDVRCMADIDVATQAGTGHLQPVAQ